MCIRDSFKTTTLYGDFLSSALAALHSLIDMETYLGKIFLLSPVFGAVQIQKFFRPPRAKPLIQSFKEKTFPKPQSLKCIVGQFNWQSEPDRGFVLCDAVNVRLNIAPTGTMWLILKPYRNFGGFKLQAAKLMLTIDLPSQRLYCVCVPSVDRLLFSEKRQTIC